MLGLERKVSTTKLPVGFVGPRFEGWLTKKGGIVRSWKRKYFVLENGLMNYYENKEIADTKPNSIKGKIQVQGSRCGGLTVKERKFENSFQIISAKKTWYVFADADSERTEWTKFLIRNGAQWDEGLRSQSFIGLDGRVELKAYQPGKSELNFDVVFGADPSKLTQSEDHGFKIPQALGVLRYCMESNGAFDKENIFRVSGSSEAVKSLKEMLVRAETTGDFMPLLSKRFDDVYALGAMIKKFYMSLPKRIFDGIDIEGLLGATLPQLKEILKQPQLDLFLWLLDLLKHTLKHKAQNGLNEQSIAVLFASTLFELPVHDPLDIRKSARLSLGKTTVATDLIERLVAPDDNPSILQPEQPKPTTTNEQINSQPTQSETITTTNEQTAPQPTQPIESQPIETTQPIEAQ